jgi:hypothetical protein
MTSSLVMSPKLENMINFRFTKSNWPKLPQSDPSFYRRFSRAWTNFQENEVEARLRLIVAEPKATKSFRAY